MSSVQDALVNNEKVQLVGFGTFETRERALDKEEIQEIQSKL